MEMINAGINTERTEKLQAMHERLAARNWQGYLDLRRSYLQGGGAIQQIRDQISSLPEELQLAYGLYFNSNKELTKQVQAQFRKQTTLRIAAKRDLRLQEQVKPQKFTLDKQRLVVHQCDQYIITNTLPHPGCCP